MVFSTRTFRNLDLGIKWLLRCRATELESLRSIVRCLERVVVVRPTYVLFSLETVSRGTFDIYDVWPIGGGGRVIGNNYVGSCQFVVADDYYYHSSSSSSSLEFFTSVLTDCFSLKFEWQQVSSSLQDSSKDSGCSQQCCHLDSLYPSANYQALC